MLEKAGVACYTVDGKARGEEGMLESYAWNIVKGDGDYYYVDVTWAELEEQEEDPQGLMIYDYLCCSEEQVADTHERDCDDTLYKINIYWS